MVEVEVRRLDGLFDEAVAGVANPRVYLKLDTQGFDLKAFAGAGHRTADLVGMQSEVSQVPLYDGMPHLTDQLAIYEPPASVFPASSPWLSTARPCG